MWRWIPDQPELKQAGHSHGICDSFVFLEFLDFRGPFPLAWDACHMWVNCKWDKKHDPLKKLSISVSLSVKIKVVGVVLLLMT